MKAFKIADCLVQFILLMVCIVHNALDEGAAWWGNEDDTAIRRSYIFNNNFLFMLICWQLISWLVHTRNPQYKKNGLRKIFSIALFALTLTAVLGYFFKLPSLSLQDSLSYISIFVLGFFILAVYYFIVSIVETKRIKQHSLPNITEV